MTTFLQHVKHLLSWREKGTDEPIQAARVAPLRQDESRPVPIAHNDPLMTYFLSTPGAVDIAKLHLNSPALQSLKNAGVKLSVPLISQGELVGLLNLGQRLSEQNYSSDDRELLSRFAIQASPAIRVARLIQHAFLPRDLPALPGWRVAAYYQPVRALLADGQEVRGDVLIGADGLHSVVRTQLFDGSRKFRIHPRLDTGRLCDEYSSLAYRGTVSLVEYSAGRNAGLASTQTRGKFATGAVLCAEYDHRFHRPYAN